MKAIVCEMCGSQNLVKQDGMYVCQSCGTKYSTEEAKKLIIDGTVDVSGSTVKVDSTDELTNLYQIARRARDTDNSENAAKYYDMILIKEPDSWEAQFYTVYYQTMQCRIGEIPTASSNLASCINNVLSLIKNNVSDESEQSKNIMEIVRKCNQISVMLYAGVWKQYQPDGYYNNPAYFKAKCIPILEIFVQLRESIVSLFGKEGLFAEVLSEARRAEIYLRKDLSSKSANQEDVNIINTLIDEEKEYNPDFSEGKVNLTQRTSSGCYVATAVYGSYDCPQVWTLRRYRDDMLAQTWYGRMFIRAYYAISPTLVKWFGNTAWFKNMWKPKLDRMVERLNGEGVENTPYEDKEW